MINLLRNASPLRRRFLRDLLLIVFLTAGAVIAVTLFLGAHLRNDICRTRIRQINIQASNDLERFFNRVDTSLNIARKWGDAGLLTTSDVVGLNAKFIPILESLPHVSTLIIAGPDGSEYLLTHDGESWLTIVTGPEGPKRRSVHTRWGERGNVVKRWTGKPSYDPRERPWYRDAVAAPHEESVIWTRPYTFADGMTPGVSGAVRWRPADSDGAPSVVAYDIPLDNIFKLVAGIPVGSRGMAFLVAGNGEVLATPRKPVDGGGPRPFLEPAVQFGKPQVAAAVATWLKKGKQSDVPVKVAGLEESWWGGFHLLGGKTFPLWLGVIAPEGDLLIDAQEGKRVIMLSGLVVLGLGVVLALFLAIRYSRHLRESHRPVIYRKDPEPGLRAFIAMGESATLEFKSTVRMNRKSGKPGKEIELAWLKAVVAFMNTVGGAILIGVNDNGELAGIEADGFETDDKCLLHLKNLFSRHIGAEFSRYISFELFTVGDKTVVVVECERAKDPVFLVNGDDEEFYVRTGPSSVRLSPSKLLTYLAARK
jgi:hypothetical protein